MMLFKLLQLEKAALMLMVLLVSTSVFIGHSASGLSFRPTTDERSTLIRFVQGHPSTYKPYTDDIEESLLYYENENQQGDNFYDCFKDNGYRPMERWSEVCLFDLTRELGVNNPCIKQNDFGYDDGMPCVIIKMDERFAWMPIAYDNNSIPAELQGDYHEMAINVRCFGESGSDKENIGDLDYFPSHGFPFKFFPFLGQQGYRTPIMFVRFNGITPGVLVMVTCRAYSKNMQSDVHFEIMVD